MATLIPTNTTSIKYSEFSESVTDFFGKDFPSGVAKVEVKTSPKGFLTAARATFSDEFKATAVRDSTTGTITAEIKNTTSFPIGKSRIDGKSITTLTSSNLLHQKLVINNAVIEGLKLSVSGALQPNGSNSAEANVSLTQGAVALGTTVDVFNGPSVTADLSARLCDFKIGGEIGYDVSVGSVNKYSLALSLDRAREKAVIQALTGFKTFNATYFQKFNDLLEVAYRASWTTKIPNLSMEVGAKWRLTDGGFLKAKLDNVGHLGFAFGTILRPGVQLTLGATVDTAKLNECSHKLGLELIYSA